MYTTSAPQAFIKCSLRNKFNAKIWAILLNKIILLNFRRCSPNSKRLGKTGLDTFYCLRDNTSNSLTSLSLVLNSQRFEQVRSLNADCQTSDWFIPVQQSADFCSGFSTEHVNFFVNQISSSFQNHFQIDSCCANFFTVALLFWNLIILFFKKCNR